MPIFRRLLPALLAVAALAGSAPVRGQITVTKPGEGKVALDLSGLRATDAAGQEVLAVLRADLERSGWFQLVGSGQGQVAVSGAAQSRGGQLQLHLEAGVPGARRLLGQTYRGTPAQARAVAHQAADELVKAVVGRPGMASARVVFVNRRGGTAKELFVMDADGHGVVQLTRDNTLSLSPKWGPRGDRLVYTSYLQRFPDVYLIELSTGQRSRLSAFPGLNTGGVLSPDGRDLALILSKDGNPELYVMQLATRRLTRLTHTRTAVEASPDWSPDGREIVYVSDAPGAPRLYIIGRDGGRARRVPGLPGNEQVNPSWGPDGRIAFSARIDGRYRIAVASAQGGGVEVVSPADGADYEDPSWMPNARHLIAARAAGRRSQLVLLDTMGDPPLVFSAIPGDSTSPHASP